MDNRYYNYYGGCSFFDCPNAEKITFIKIEFLIELNDVFNMSQDKLIEVKKQTDAVITIMKENIDKTIRRGEDLERLEARAIELDTNARIFQQQSKALKRKMCWQHYRYYILSVLLVTLTIVILLLVLCGAKMQC